MGDTAPQKKDGHACYLSLVGADRSPRITPIRWFPVRLYSAQLTNAKALVQRPKSVLW